MTLLDYSYSLFKDIKEGRYSFTFAINKKASEFSFLLSVPIIIGGFVLELLKTSDTGVNLQDFQFITYIFAFLLTFVVSILAMKLTVKFLKKQKFIVFSVYTFLMFIVSFIYNFLI